MCTTRPPQTSTLSPYTTLFRSLPLRARPSHSHRAAGRNWPRRRSEEHTSELQSRGHLVCRLLLGKKKSVKWYWSTCHSSTPDSSTSTKSTRNGHKVVSRT